MVIQSNPKVVSIYIYIAINVRNNGIEILVEDTIFAVFLYYP